MAMSSLAKTLEELPDDAKVFVDTNPIIYVLEKHPLAKRYHALFAGVAEGRFEAVISPVTLSEIAAGPLSQGNRILAERYRILLTCGEGWTFHPLDADTAMLAAEMRVKYRLRLPDAIQAATAIRTGCQYLITHDRDFSGIDGIVCLG
jgi:predicted nucleic acid-binding protein